MRFRVGIILSVLTMIIGVGCRKPLAPNVDRNDPPETWITAAPQDTITSRDADNNPNVSPIGTIAVRYHLYWAGADRDGAVAGFYYAVVETLPIAPAGLPKPQLPGPKPRDYRFTAKSDSVFIFNVSEFAPDRQHAFFIYAVDDKGKADATPARFVFNALDRFPPNPAIFEAVATGPTYKMLSNGTLRVDTLMVSITDSLIGNQSRAPKDTIPGVAKLVFKWRGEPSIQGTYVTGYKYKLDESSFISVPAESSMHVYRLGSVAPGVKKLTFKVLDQAGGAKETNRFFQMNYSPDTWFAGPDTLLFPVQSDGTRYVTPGENGPITRQWLLSQPQFAHSMFSSDSLTLLPALRRQRISFYEIYKDKVYARAEGDTVNMNSWVVFHAGGSDIDSPYNVAVRTNEPALTDTQYVTGIPYVIRPGPPNGSPIGFQFIYTTIKEPLGSFNLTPLSGLTPVFDAARVDRNPTIGAYIPCNVAGRIFLTLKSVDGDGAADKRVPDPRALVLNGNPGNPLLRSRAISFYVDRAPYLTFERPGFVPRRDTTFFTRSNLRFNLFADDDDPLDPQNRPPAPGGPSDTKVFRWNVKIVGIDSVGGDRSYIPPGGEDQSHPDIIVNIPDGFGLPGQPTDLTAEVELCDCGDCEMQEGTGRCVTYRIPFHVPAPPSPATGANQPSMTATPRPGFNPSTSRSTP